LGGGPADDRLLDLVGELFLELGARLLAGDDDHSWPTKAPQPPVEGRRDVLEVILDELLDVALVARLRPAALVVPARLLVELLFELLEPPSPEPVEIPPLTTDDSYEQALAPPDERHERPQVEHPTDLDPVGHSF